MQETRSDEALMDAYVAGDRAAFDALFRRYATRLGEFLARGLRRREDARDLLQQVFLQVHRHRNDYEQGRPFRPWLYTIALNLKRQHLRTLRRKPESELDEASLKRLRDDSIDQKRYEMRQQLDHALGQLSAEARDVVLLHWFGGLPLAEVAAVVGASESAVKVRAHRAYQAMRRVFGAESARALALENET
jgi:RNA polymerase sigma-70 factor (ECF subfamily)